jgi:hypothetical protein
MLKQNTIWKHICRRWESLPLWLPRLWILALRIGSLRKERKQRKKQKQLRSKKRKGTRHKRKDCKQRKP